MKKILLFVLAVILVAPVSYQPLNAAWKTPLEKALAKQYKKKLKEFKKEGWKLSGSSSTLEVALLQHYDKLAKGDMQEIVATVDHFKSRNVGQQVVLNNACITYARQAGSSLRGRVNSDLNYNGDDAAVEFDKMYSAYESLVEKEIRGELKQSFTLIRDNGDGTYSMESFFLVDEDSASRARIKAMAQAAKESGLAQEYARMVGEFVREGFSIETE